MTKDSEFEVNVFNSEGEAWRKMRRTLSPSFSASKVKMVHLRPIAFLYFSMTVSIVNTVSYNYWDNLN